MNRLLAEILLFVSVAINAALLIFIAGVLRKIMNDMNELEFKHFVDSLYRHSARSPFMHTVLTIPLAGAIPYFHFNGFGNRWITAGLALWLVAGSIAKIIKVPVFKAVASLDSGHIAEIGKQRRRLNTGNMLQAILTFAAALVMAVTFVGR